MKTTFKKSIAAISAAAVVAASAAVFAIPADAAATILTVGTVELTLDELKAADYMVTVPVSVSGSNGWNELGFGVSYNVSNVTCDTVAGGTEIVNAIIAGKAVAPGIGINNDEGIAWAGYAVSPKVSGTDKVPQYVSDGVAVNITFKVNTNAKEGDVYPITAVTESEGNSQTVSSADGTSAPSSLVDGAIIIKGETTTTTTTTEGTTTSKSGGTTSSPQTSDVLPVAGAAAALVVIGGVALVAKKRK